MMSLQPEEAVHTYLPGLSQTTMVWQWQFPICHGESNRPNCRQQRPQRKTQCSWESWRLRLSEPNRLLQSTTTATSKHRKLKNKGRLVHRLISKLKCINNISNKSVELVVHFIRFNLLICLYSFIQYRVLFLYQLSYNRITKIELALGIKPFIITSAAVFLCSHASHS